LERGFQAYSAYIAEKSQLFRLASVLSPLPAEIWLLHRFPFLSYAAGALPARFAAFFTLL
jgi:hypothetical protein